MMLNASSGNSSRWLGTRLGKMTEKIPKSLIEVSGKPISHILDWVKARLQQSLILTGHLGEMFEQFEYEVYQHFTRNLNN